jgi:hypothetical protein
MTIHWKALEEHFLMVPLDFRLIFMGKNALKAASSALFGD